MNRLEVFSGKREEYVYSNVYIKGNQIGLWTEQQILNGFSQKRRVKNIIKNGNKFEAQILFRKNANFINSSYWRDKGNFNYFIVDQKEPFFFDNVDNFQFFNTTIDYIYMPGIKNDGLGRQAFQDGKFKKIAYFPLVVNSGRRTFWGINNVKTKIYLPSIMSFKSNDIFRSSGNFSNAKMYLLKSTWENSNNANINTFINNGGTVLYIDNFIKPEKPTNTIISNITSNSFDISFNQPNSFNNIEDYEVFCVDEDYPVSKYFYHQQINTTSATIIGLVSNKTYKIKVRTTDIYYNLSEFSDEITIQTL